MNFRSKYILLTIYFGLALMSCQSRLGQTKVDIGKSTTVSPHISVSKRAYQHYSYRKLSQILFDSSLNAPSTLQYDGQSVWLKMRFDSVCAPICLDFINYYEAEGFDAGYQPLKRISYETLLTSDKHERHFAFALPMSDVPQVYYFKLYNIEYELLNKLQLAFVPAHFLQSTIRESFYNTRLVFVGLMILVGVAFFQILYITSLAWSRRRPEYWYYLLFMLMGILYILAVRRFELGLGESKWLIPTSIVSHIGLVSFFYARFVRDYLGSSNLNANISKQFTAIEIFVLAGVAINIIIYVSTNDIGYASQFHEAFDKAVKIINIYFLCLLCYIQGSVLVIYLLLGSVTMVIPGVFIAVYEFGVEKKLWDIFMNVNLLSLLSTMGSMLDAICLNLGLSYKHRLEVIAQQKALENERNRIASELHDDLGSGLSTIRLLGESAQSDLQNVEKRTQIQKITTESSDLIERMSTIIWAMNSQNDTFDNLIPYLRRYAFDYLEDTHRLNLDFALPEIPPSVSRALLKGNDRRELFLTFKEVLHNIVKHAETDRVFIGISLIDNALAIQIKDFGKGLKEANPQGNGLKNMAKRMATIGGKFTIFSCSTEGVVITLTLPINKS